MVESSGEDWIFFKKLVYLFLLLSTPIVGLALMNLRPRVACFSD